MTATGKKINLYVSSVTINELDVIPTKEMIEFRQYQKEYFSGSPDFREYWLSTNSYTTNTFANGPHDVHLRLEQRNYGNNSGWTFTAISVDVSDGDDVSKLHRFQYNHHVVGYLRTMGKKPFFTPLKDGNYLAMLNYSGWNNACVQLGNVVHQE